MGVLSGQRYCQCQDHPAFKTGTDVSYTIQCFITCGRVKPTLSSVSLLAGQLSHTIQCFITCGRVRSQDSDRKTALHYSDISLLVMFHYLWESKVTRQQ